MTSLLSASDLAAERAAQREYLPDTCDILALVTTRTTAGGRLDTESTLASGVPCRLVTVTPGLRGLHGLVVTPETVYLLTMASGQTLTSRNRVKVAGVTYNVQSVNNADSNATAIRATLAAVQVRPL